MTNALVTLTEIKWTFEHENMLAGLIVLSTVGPNQKIKIKNASTLHIKVENRYFFVGIRRFWTGDGSKPSADIIGEIMQKSISFLSICFENPTAVQNSTISAKYLEVKKHYAPAIIGICHLKNLYASPDENDLKVAQNLTEKINGYISPLFVLAEKEEALKLPKASVPIDPAMASTTMTQVMISNVAIPIIAGACSSVSLIGTAMSFRNILWDLITLDRNQEYAVLTVVHAGLRFLNMTGMRPA